MLLREELSRVNTSTSAPLPAVVDMASLAALLPLVSWVVLVIMLRRSVTVWLAPVLVLVALLLLVVIETLLGDGEENDAFRCCCCCAAAAAAVDDDADDDAMPPNNAAASFCFSVNTTGTGLPPLSTPS